MQALGDQEVRYMVHDEPLQKQSHANVQAVCRQWKHGKRLTKLTSIEVDFAPPGFS